MSDPVRLPLSAPLPLRLRNLGASLAVVVLAVGVFSVVPHTQDRLATLYGWGSFTFTGYRFLWVAALLYGAGLAVFHALLHDPAEATKSVRFWRVVTVFLTSPAALIRQGLPPEDRVAVLATLLKAFFGPLMALALMSFCTGAVEHGVEIVASGAFAEGFRVLFDRHGFWFLMQLILFVDVLLFTIGYLVESPRLGNQIRSVDPTLVGWAAAMLCYPPFNSVTSAVLGSQVSDFPQFDDPTAHLTLNLLLLGLMAVYASASVALGWKASNLTHRGIVARGPYALIRHPAYTCKNIAWWIGSIPMVSAAFHVSLFAGIQAFASVVGWTMLYILRALTEEDHLRGVDGDYAAYAAKVRYRFVPGVV
ncbi:MAG: hypothetical protein V4792_18135 [Pseudomonadota bacterium]